MATKDEKEKVTEPIDYVPSAAVEAAQAQLNAHIQNKPGAYTSPWTERLNAALNQALNRAPFSYDPSSDHLYQQYRDQYQNQANLGMRDAMGQATALTGGYANSYAQTAGQQAYNQTMSGLNNVIPELYNLALSRYTQEGSDLLNNYSLLAAQEDAHRATYDSDVARWEAERDRLQALLNTERDFDYGQHIDQVGQERWQSEVDGNIIDLGGGVKDYSAIEAELEQYNGDTGLIAAHLVGLLNIGEMSLEDVFILMDKYGVTGTEGGN